MRLHFTLGFYQFLSSTRFSKGCWSSRVGTRVHQTAAAAMEAIIPPSFCTSFWGVEEEKKLVIMIAHGENRIQSIFLACVAKLKLLQRTKADRARLLSDWTFRIKSWAASITPKDHQHCTIITCQSIIVDFYYLHLSSLHMAEMNNVLISVTILKKIADFSGNFYCHFSFTSIFVVYLVAMI